MSRSLPRARAALLRSWPACALAVWSAAWRAGLAAPDDVLHTLHDYAQAHEIDPAPGTGIDAGGTELELLHLVGAAPLTAIVSPAPGDAQGLPPGALTEAALSAGEVLLLSRTGAPPLAMTAHGTAERCRWAVRALSGPVDLEALGAERGLGDLEYELRESVAEAANVIAGLAGPRTGGPADLRDALAARTAASTLDLPPHDRQRVDRILATVTQLDAIIDLARGPGISAEQLASADDQLRRLAALTRRARTAAVNALLRDYRTS